MIPRSRCRLRIALLALLAFVAGSTEDLWATHACPHHDRVPGQEAGGHGGMAHGPADDAHAPADAAHEPSDAAPASMDAGHADASGDHEHSGPCTCLGQCQAGTAAPPAPAPRAIRRAPEAAELPLTATAAPDPGLAPTPYRLHRSNAPPLSV